MTMQENENTLPEWADGWDAPQLNDAKRDHGERRRYGCLELPSFPTSIRGKNLYDMLSPYLRDCLNLEEGQALAAEISEGKIEPFGRSRIYLFRSVVRAETSELLVPFIQVIRRKPAVIYWWWLEYAIDTRRSIGTVLT